MSQVIENTRALLEKTKLSKLPSLPHVLAHLLSVCDRSNTSSEMVTDIVATDPALSLKVLSTAALDSQPAQKINSLRQAIELIGVPGVRSIARTSSVHSFFSRMSDDKTRYLKYLWWHSYYSAVLSHQIAHKLHYSSTDEAYLAGLMHDLGRTVLLSNFSDYAEKAIHSESTEAFYDREKKNLGVVHNEVGSQLLRQQGMPASLADAALYHHEPTAKLLDAHPLVRIVRLANHISKEDGRSTASARLMAEQLLHLEVNTVDEVVRTAREKVKAKAEQLQIDSVFNKPKKIVLGDIDHLQKQHLAHEVRNTALVDSTKVLFQAVTRKEELVYVTRQTANLLFGINNLFIFTGNDDNTVLEAWEHNVGNSLVDQLEIPVESGRSLLVDCFVNGKEVSSFEAPDLESINVVDRQIIAALGNQGMLIAPLMAANQKVGVLVMGASEVDVARMEKRARLLQLYLQDVSAAIEYQRARSSGGLTKGYVDREQIKNRIRETVHEANNPLGIIKNYLQILSNKLDEDHPAKEDLRIIGEEIQRVAGILANLSDLPGEEQQEPQSSSDINDVIRDLISVYQRSLLDEHGVVVNLELDESLPNLALNINNLKQILTNLIKNAAEAMPNSGSLIINSVDHLVNDNGEFVEISVSDSGPGIDEQVLSHLFEPVTSTKGDGHAGLGLTIAKSLVKEMGGSISCHTRKNKGTTFKVLLPRKMVN